MTVTVVEGNVTSPAGVRAAGGACGIKADRPDLALIVTDAPAAAAACFTTNQVQAAPVQVSRAQIRRGHAQAVVINSGNANACTGATGLRDAWEMVDLTAQALGITRDLVLVASTGVIGVPLPMERLRVGIPALAAALGVHGDALPLRGVLSGFNEVSHKIVLFLWLQLFPFEGILQNSVHDQVRITPDRRGKMGVAG
jgi:glutamate N-acetyltransferase/amino-acid N-acetyltransferase